MARLLVSETLNDGGSDQLVSEKDPGTDKVRDFDFTVRDFKFIRDLVFETTGIVLSEIKRDMVYGRLSRRIRALGLTKFSQYCDILKSEDHLELKEFTNAITTNLTSFFRENHHFEGLKNIILPKLLAEKADRKIRIWSAGCSTGEEPYSIAMTVKETVPASQDWDIKILATDLDTNVLDKAASGVYDAERVAGIPKQRLKHWFHRGKGANDGVVKVVAELRDMITFRQLNLMHEWPMSGTFDIIFCRNVVIYFDKATQKILFDRYSNILSGNGYLFLGHSESMFKVANSFNLIGKTIYQNKTE